MTQPRFKLDIYDWFCLVLPITSFWEIDLIGRLLVTELVLLLLFPFLLLARGSKLWERPIRYLLVFGILWLVAQIATDLLVHTPFEDYIRGWAKIAFFMTNLSALYILFDNSVRRVTLFIIGLGITTMVSFRYQGSDLDPWKFGYPLSASYVLLACWALLSRSYKGGLIFVITAPALGLLLLFQNARGLAGFWLFTGALLISNYYLTTKGRNSRNASFRQAAAICLFLIGSAIGILKLYEFLASRNYLGEESFDKYIMQTGTGHGVLLGGRGEVYIGLEAIADSPVIGHGSWAKDDMYVSMLFDLQGKNYTTNDQTAAMGLIPTHSHIFGAWVEAGFFGALFWIVLVGLLAKTVFQLLFIKSTINPLVFFALVVLLWDIFFSPFGFDRRLTVPIGICLIAIVDRLYRLDRLPRFPLDALATHPQMRPQIKSGPFRSL